MTVTLNVSEVNDAPVPAADPLADIAEDSGARVISFASLTATTAAARRTNLARADDHRRYAGRGGSVQIVGTDVIFAPDANFNGAASFTYTVQDNGTTNGGADPLSGASAATVSFNITEVNDAPVAVDDPIASIGEDSGDYTISLPR